MRKEGGNIRERWEVRKPVLKSQKYEGKCSTEEVEFLSLDN